jgi:hypothetical protein
MTLTRRSATEDLPAAGPARPRKRRRWVGFALSGVLFVLAVFVLHGAIAGMAALASMLAFITACLLALRGAEPAGLAAGDRTAIGGWVGGWF